MVHGDTEMGEETAWDKENAETLMFHLQQNHSLFSTFRSQFVFDRDVFS